MSECAEVIQRLALLGMPAEALTHYASLRDPDPVSQRWAGVARLWQAEYGEARALLEVAAARGERGAHLHLAYLHRVQGELGFAEIALHAAGTLSDPLDRCLEARERAFVLLAQDRLREASRQLEMGWGESHHTGYGPQLRPGLALLHGVILYALGEHGAALRWLEQAGAGGAGQRVYAHGWRAAAFAQLGRTDEAFAALTEAESVADQVPLCHALHRYQLGITLRLLNLPEKARAALEASAEIAEARGEAETAAAALLASVGLALEHRPDPVRLRLLLARARRHSATPALRALLGWRTAQVQPQPAAARARAIEHAAEDLERLERRRDAVLAWLHAAEAWLCAEDAGEAQRILGVAAESCYALGPLNLGAEFRTLPGVRRALEALSPDHPWRFLLPAAPARLELRVLGEPGLWLDGAPLKLWYGDAPEYLYYLTLHPGVSSGTLARTLRPDAPLRQTQKYLSNLLGALARTGLAETRNSPRTGVWLTWQRLEVEVDVQRLERHLAAGEVTAALALYRPLLPGGGEWARQEAELLEHRLLGAGIAQLETLMAEGHDAEAQQLAEGLLTLDPFDPLLNGYLLEAVERRLGHVGAQRHAQQRSRVFDQEGLAVPREVRHYLN